MRISSTGIEFLKEVEGFSPIAYLDSAGHPTIGYGHKILRSDKWERISEEEASFLLAQDVWKAESDVNRLVTVPLSGNEFDALVSFVFNLGAGALGKSTLLKLLNQKKYAEAALELRHWVKARNPRTKKLEVVDGLVNRREKEKQLWLGEWRKDSD